MMPIDPPESSTTDSATSTTRQLQPQKSCDSAHTDVLYAACASADDNERPSILSTTFSYLQPLNCYSSTCNILPNATGGSCGNCLASAPSATLEEWPLTPLPGHRTYTPSSGMYSTPANSDRVNFIPPQAPRRPQPESPFNLAGNDASHVPKPIQSSMQLLERLPQGFSTTHSSCKDVGPPPAPRRPQPQHLHRVACNAFPAFGLPVQSSMELLQRASSAGTASSY